VILLDAGTFVVAAGTVLALRLREPRPDRDRRAAGSRGSWRAEISAGLRHAARTPALRRPLTACLIAACAFGFFETVPFAVVAQGLHRSPAFLGVLIFLQGVGALAGGVLAGPVMRRTSESTLIAGGLAACAAAALLLITASLPVVGLASAALGLCIVWINVGAVTLIQRRTPPALIGRVDAALEFAIVVPQAVSIALGAALIAVVNYRILLIVMAAVIGFSAGYLARRRDKEQGQTATSALQQADSMPRESAGTL
jgi:predicted MFS family arabinose efflux permease